jgi:hypothetical protein
MRILLTILFASAFFEVYGQEIDLVQWQFSGKKINANKYELHLKATVTKPWHIYSQHTPPGGPVPTSIMTKSNPLVALDGEAAEVGKLVTRYEATFRVNVQYFGDQVDFVQVVKMKAGIKTTIAGTITYMVCNDKECQPPKEQAFTVQLN